jgi:hypothetical protein
MQLRADNSALSERMKTVKAAMDELQAVKEEGEAALRKLLQRSQRLLREATGDLDACRRETSQHLEKRENDFGEEIHALCLANDHLGTKQRSEERDGGGGRERKRGRKGEMALGVGSHCFYLLEYRFVENFSVRQYLLYMSNRSAPLALPLSGRAD